MVNIMISQWELKFETSKLLEVPENANDQGVIVFSILSDWCGEWLKPQQSQIAPSALLIYSMEKLFEKKLSESTMWTEDWEEEKLSNIWVEYLLLFMHS